MPATAASSTRVMSLIRLVNRRALITGETGFVLLFFMA